MFDKMKGMMGQFQLFQRLMKDENFRALISHPKIQLLMKDPEFLEILKTNDFQKILTHPEFSTLRDDKEIALLASKLSLSKAPS